MITRKSTDTNESITRSFFSSLWEGGKWAYWWTPNSGRYYTDKRTGARVEAKASIWFPVNRPAPIPNHWLNEKDVYFSLNPSTVQRERWQRSTISTIGVVNALFAEFDAKDYGSIDAIFDHLDRLDRYPTGVIFSGGGLHCYWLLSWPYRIITDDNRDRIRRLQAAWVGLVGGDPAAKDIARSPRVPGSRNWKSAYAPVFPHVSFVEWWETRRYDLALVEALAADRIAEIAKTEKAKQAEDMERTEEVAAGAARQILDAMVRNASVGQRRALALWGAGKLKKEGIEDWAAEAVLRDYAGRVGWDDRDVDKQIAGVIRWHYSGGKKA